MIEKKFIDIEKIIDGLTAVSSQETDTSGEELLQSIPVLDNTLAKMPDRSGLPLRSPKKVSKMHATFLAQVWRTIILMFLPTLTQATRSCDGKTYQNSFYHSLLTLTRLSCCLASKYLLLSLLLTFGWTNTSLLLVRARTGSGNYRVV